MVPLAWFFAKVRKVFETREELFKQRVQELVQRMAREMSKAKTLEEAKAAAQKLADSA